MFKCEKKQLNNVKVFDSIIEANSKKMEFYGIFVLLYFILLNFFLKYLKFIQVYGIIIKDLDLGRNWLYFRRKLL